MVFDVTTLKEKACCENPSCMSTTWDRFDCECGSDCVGCKYPEGRN